MPTSPPPRALRSANLNFTGMARSSCQAIAAEPSMSKTLIVTRIRGAYSPVTRPLKTCHSELGPRLAP